MKIICDSDLMILSVDPSNCGAPHDSTVWNNHPLKGYLENLHNQGETLWLLGETGYPQCETMMAPIVDAAAGTPAARYTERQVKGRNCVERCIGVLKARWRCLLVARKLHYTPEAAASFVNPCAVLHNIAHKAKLAVPELTPEQLNEEQRRQISCHFVEVQTRQQSVLNLATARADPENRRVTPELLAERASRDAFVERLQ